MLNQVNETIIIFYTVDTGTPLKNTLQAIQLKHYTVRTIQKLAFSLTSLPKSVNLCLRQVVRKLLLFPIRLSSHKKMTVL